jgi:hypothetical protein
VIGGPEINQYREACAALDSERREFEPNTATAGGETCNEGNAGVSQESKWGPLKAEPELQFTNTCVYSIGSPIGY